MGRGDASKVRPAQLGQREGLGPVDRPSCCTHLGQVGRLGDGSEFNPWPANCRARVTSSVTLSPHVASWYRQVASTGLIGRLGGSFGKPQTEHSDGSDWHCSLALGLACNRLASIGCVSRETADRQVGRIIRLAGGRQFG